jgi:hypothetical protein
MRTLLPRLAVPCHTLALAAGFLCCSLALAQEPALPGWRRLANCRKPEGNVTFQYDWQATSSIEFLVRREAGDATATLVLDPEGLAVTLDVDGVTTGGKTRTYSVVPDGDAANVHVTLKLRTTEWAIYLNDGLAGTLPAPFALPGDAFVEEHRAEWIRSQPLFRPVPHEGFHSDFMIEEGAPNQLYPWKPESGDWRIHTALEDALARPESDLARIKQVPLTPDKSPNFYSLKGMGENAIITTGYDFFDNYDYAAAMQINAGEAGLIFYHHDAGNYYAFTIDLLDGKQEYGILRLWRMRDGKRTVLAQAKAAIYPDQWYMPRVRAHTNEIVCLLDNYPVMTVSELLPVGGKVGLFANHNQEIRFDDVYLEDYERLPLRNAGEIRYESLVADDSFFRTGGLFGSEVSAGARELHVPASPEPQTLVLGRPHHEGIFFGADFAPAATDGEFGLIAGYQGRDKPFYRCVVKRDGDRETFRLERVTDGAADVLDSWTRDQVGNSSPRLAVDATEEGWLRFLQDDQLVLLQPVEGRLGGAAGIWIGPSTEMTMRNLRYDFEREQYKEQLQQNEVFAHDSFMRHWSSAEGQWIAGRGGFLWHKGDFFSDFSVRMPCIPNSRLLLGVPEDSTDGSVVVGIAPDKLTLTIALPNEEAQTYDTPLVPAAGKSVSDMEYTIHHEGYWVWVTLAGKRVLRHRLDGPLPGRQARVDGLTLADLHRSLVTRINVIDDAFAESPHNWLINGGKWQIVNRFQCTPSWSHMIGESHDTMAALWYKAVFSGDLTLEFYAGTRHGEWYQRMGDLNCTVMADRTTPSSGYTVTCTEWDKDLSQKWSTLRRNGDIMDRSDAYLVPRRRAGLVRKFLNPLVSKGRPYHGAWYYIKLRKFGDKLEYYFDNEKIFEETDPDAIQEGLLGIWTFMHSMTVAQVKITFQRMHPRPVQLLGSPDSPEEPAAPTPPEVTLNGFPLQSLSPDHWEISDTVGHTTIDALPGSSDGLAVIDRLGSGTMLAKPNFPPVELRRLAGWQLLLKRTPDAEFNIYYSIGVKGSNGVYTPQRNLVHHISGDAFDGDTEIETGSTHVPGSPASDLAVGWTPVNVWIPEGLRTPNDTTGAAMVRLEGIGNMGESNILCGVTGNGPGAGFFVRQLSPVFYGNPELAAKGTPALYVLRDVRHGAEILRTEDPAAVDQALLAETTTGLNTAWLRVKYGEGDGYSRKLAWASLPEAPAWDVSWAEHEPDAIVLRRTGDVPDPRFAGAAIALADGTALPAEADNEGRLVARLPRTAAGMASSEPLRLQVTVAGKAIPTSLDWHDRPLDDRPVLLAIKGLPGFCATFENGFGRLSHTADARQTMQYDNPDQGRYLQVRNTALGQRLYATFGTDFSMARYPICQFRYRAYDMTYISLGFSNGHYVRLSDDLAEAVKVRYADHDLVADEAWHTWQGMISDAFTNAPFDRTRFQPSYARFGSAHGVDQTGRYTKFDLDNLVFGPAVSQAKQLSFTPEFFDTDGIKDVSVAISPTATSYADLSPEQRASLKWVSQPVGQPITPDLSVLGGKNGVYYLLYKATDANGKESRPIDLPFLLDTQPMTASVSFPSTSDADSNGLHAVIALNNGGGAPWAIGKSSFEIAGKKSRVYTWSNAYQHSAASEKLILNYPLIMRSQLDEASNGQTVSMTIKDIVDGAGNPSPDLAVPYTINYAKDKLGPSWYWLKFGTSVHWSDNWDGSFNASVAFTPGSYNHTDVIKRLGGASYLRNLSYRDNADLSRKVDWKPATHPWLSCRLYLPRYRDGLRLIFTLATNYGNYTISTIAPGKAASELGRGLNLPWAPKRWIPLSVNVADRLKQAGLTDAKLAKLVVSTLTISRRNCANREPMYLDDFYLHGTPGKNAASNSMTWYAYDCSGVASLEMACLDPNGKPQWTETETGRTVDLHQLAAKVKGCQWFSCQARDKAGNLSTPFYLPIAGN